MSVNTPKRPKTAYYAGIVDENEMFGSPTPNHPDPNLHFAYFPGTTNADPHMPATKLNHVSSPSSSCGSPEMSSNVLRTPKSSGSTTTNGGDQQRDLHQLFPTPLDTVLSSGGREHKRGRPRSESLTNLMMQGSTSPSAIKCKFCNRVFPREKSLAAHLRTHTGERPYVCDYPGCTKSFTQSGQMKTHQRLHTGERPFICAVPACEMRFTHANRHCPVHVNAVLKRDDKFVVKMTPEQNEEVLVWLEKYRAEREDKSTPTRKTPQRSRANTPSGTPSTHVQTPTTSTSSTFASSEDLHNNNNSINNNNHLAEKDSSSSSSSSTNGSNATEKQPNDENECPMTPTTPSKNPYKSRKGLMVELDMNAGLAMSPLAPLKMKPQPKLIQWQEPLSQGEDEDDEEPPQRNYYVPEKVKTPQKSRQKENRQFSPSKKSLMKQGAGVSTFNPKKKWLREACMEDLAKPLDGGEGVLGSPQKLQIKSMNLLRPTVLMLASKDKQIPLGSSNGSNGFVAGDSLPVAEVGATAETNRRWLGKMALMQLAQGDALTQSTPVAPPQLNGGYGVHSTTGDLPEYTQL